MVTMVMLVMLVVMVKNENPIFWGQSPSPWDGKRRSACPAASTWEIRKRRFAGNFGMDFPSSAGLPSEDVPSSFWTGWKRRCRGGWGQWPPPQEQLSSVCLVRWDARYNARWYLIESQFLQSWSRLTCAYCADWQTLAGINPLISGEIYDDEISNMGIYMMMRYHIWGDIWWRDIIYGEKNIQKK